MHYYDVLADDVQCGKRWFLGEPHDGNGGEIDARLFRYGTAYVGRPPATIPVDRAGTEVAFNLGAFDMPVIRDDVRQALASVTTSGYELFPVLVGSSASPFWILNVTERDDCVDESASVFRKWVPEDDRPDRLGAYRSISTLRLDVRRVRNQIFRVRGWEVAMIVSHEIRNALSSVHDLGVVFSKV